MAPSAISPDEGAMWGRLGARPGSRGRLSLCRSVRTRSAWPPDGTGCCTCRPATGQRGRRRCSCTGTGRGALVTGVFWPSVSQKSGTACSLAPDARAATRDILRGGYGPDVAFIDRALT